jgi:hypothetical protein
LTRPAGPLVQRSQGDLRDPAHEVVVRDRIGLLPRDDGGHCPGGEAGGGKRQQEGQQARRQGRQRRPEADGDGLDHEARRRKGGKPGDDENQDRHPAGIDPSQQSSHGAALADVGMVAPMGVEIEALVHELAEGKARHQGDGLDQD